MKHQILGRKRGKSEIRRFDLSVVGGANEFYTDFIYSGSSARALSLFKWYKDVNLESLSIIRSKENLLAFGGGDSWAYYKPLPVEWFLDPIARLKFVETGGMIAAPYMEAFDPNNWSISTGGIFNTQDNQAPLTLALKMETNTAYLGRFSKENQRQGGFGTRDLIDYNFSGWDPPYEIEFLLCLYTPGFDYRRTEEGWVSGFFPGGWGIPSAGARGEIPLDQFPQANGQPFTLTASCIGGNLNVLFEIGEANLTLYSGPCMPTAPGCRAIIFQSIGTHEIMGSASKPFPIEYYRYVPESDEYIGEIICPLDWMHVDLRKKEEEP